MNGYINHLIQRHTEPAANVQPRLAGIFERPAYEAGFPVTENNAYPVQPQEHKYPTGPVENLLTAPLRTNKGSFLQEDYLRKEAVVDSMNFPPKQHSATDHAETVIPSFSKQANDNEKNPGLVAKAVNLWDQSIPGPDPLLIQPLATVPQNERVKHKLEKKTESVKHATKESSPAISSYQPGITPRLKNVEIERRQEQAPVIKVTIGRIEVKAINSAAPVKTTRTAIAAPKLSLDDYLKQRNNAG